VLYLPTDSYARSSCVFGSKNRYWSDKYGLVTDLCLECHEQVHKDRELDLRLKREYQKRFESNYSHEAFMRIFGRNYL